MSCKFSNAVNNATSIRLIRYYWWSILIIAHLACGNLNTPYGSSLADSVIWETRWEPRRGGTVLLYCAGFTNSTPIIFTMNTWSSSGTSSSITRTGMLLTSTLSPIMMLLLPSIKSSPGVAKLWSDCKAVTLPVLVLYQTLIAPIKNEKLRDKTVCLGSTENRRGPGKEGLAPRPVQSIWKTK